MISSSEPNNSHYWNGNAYEDGERQRQGLREDTHESDYIKNDRYRQDIPIDQVDRTEPENLFNIKRKHFLYEQAEALGYFLTHQKSSEWMRKQKGYLEPVPVVRSQ